MLEKHVIYGINVLSNDAYINNSMSSAPIKKVKQLIGNANIYLTVN